MSKPCTFVVLSNPVAGKEDDYNTWYSNVHLKDMLKVPGFTHAQRFKANAVSGGGAPQFEYMALYEAVCKDPQEMLDEVIRRAGGLEMPISDGMDSNYFAVAYEPITGIVHAIRQPK